MRCTHPLISKDNFLNNLSFKQHKLLNSREQRHKTAILQNLPFIRIPEPGNIHWDGFIPHCVSIMPDQTKSAGSHSRKMLSLKFRRRFTSLHLTAMPVGTILCSIPSRATMLSIAGTSSHETGFCPPLSLHKHRRIKRRK